MTVELNQRVDHADSNDKSKHANAVSLSMPEDTRSLDEQIAPAMSQTRSVAPPDCSSVSLKRSSSVRGSHHRRAQTISATSKLELQQLQQLMQMEVLQHDLASKSKELEESQEEAHLAALIGQSLLQRTEEMGAEIESTNMELLSRAENAEHEVKILEDKLSKAYAHIRSMEIAKAKTVDESDEIAHEVETLRLRVRALTAQVAKAHDETQQLRIAKAATDDALEATTDALAKLQSTHARLLTESKAQTTRLQELESTDRYNVEHIARLEIENQSMCLQSRVLERREQKREAEFESIATKLAAQQHAACDADAAKREFEIAIETMTDELDDLKQALATEQLRVAHLTAQNEELQDRLDDMDASKPEDARTALSGFGSSPTLRRGSLFYELAMQLKDELRQNQQPGRDCDATKGAATRALLHDNDNDTSDDNNDDDASAVDGATTTAALPPISTSSNDNVEFERSQDEEDILKEFFMLTAAAVKIAGGGLGNDTCNILNEDLYDEAQREGLTFDQYHKWLEHRLEGAPEAAAALTKHAMLLPKSPGRASRRNSRQL